MVSLARFVKRPLLHRLLLPLQEEPLLDHCTSTPRSKTLQPLNATLALVRVTVEMPGWPPLGPPVPLMAHLETLAATREMMKGVSAEELIGQIEAFDLQSGRAKKGAPALHGPGPGTGGSA